MQEHCRSRSTAHQLGDAFISACPRSPQARDSPRRTAFVSPLAFAENAASLVPDLIEGFFGFAKSGGLDFLTIGLPGASPEARELRRRFHTCTWSSRFYQVEWPEKPSLPGFAREWRLIFPRCSFVMSSTLVLPEIPGLWSRESLTASRRDEMFALLSRHFEGVTRRQFESDLSEKNWVLEIRREGCLCGFSTLLVTEVETAGNKVTAIYSGDTIVAPEAWGSPELARAWIMAVNHLKAAFPEQPCYWLLLTSGFRTYRFLPVFWREFYPRHNTSTPGDVRRLLDHLALSRYGSAFDRKSGIVRFLQPQRLRADLRVTAEGRHKDQHVAFFPASAIPATKMGTNWSALPKSMRPI